MTHTTVYLKWENREVRFFAPDAFYAARMLDRFDNPAQRALLERLRPMVQVAVDVGAHIGDTLVPWAVAWPQAKFYAIEPFPESFDYLQQNSAQFHPRVTCVRAAAGAEAGTVELALPDPSQRNRRRDPGRPTRLYSVFGRGPGRFTAEQRRLDDIVPDTEQVDFLKVDVEGYELDVLRGALRLLNRDRPVLAVELLPGMQAQAGRKPEMVVEHLVQHGYTELQPFGTDRLFGHQQAWEHFEGFRQEDAPPYLTRSRQLLPRRLLRVIHRPRFADHRHLDLPRILHRLLDLARHVFR